MNTDNLLYIKKSYTKELISNIRNQYYNIFNNIFNNLSKTNQFKNFQIELKNIASWNQHIIDKNVGLILQNKDYDYIKNLLKIILTTEINIFESMNNKKINKNNIIIPPFNNFSHKTLIECARHFYSNPLIFNNKLPSKKKQKNIREIIFIIEKSIKTTIRKLLPLKKIINNSLYNNNNNNNSSKYPLVENITENDFLNNETNIINKDNKNINNITS